MILKIGFAKQKKWKPISALIMWLDRSDCSHLYTVFHDGRYYQATISSGIVGFCDPQDLFAEYDSVEEICLEFPSGSMERIMAYAELQSGHKYGLWQLCGNLIAKILNKASFGHLKIKNPFADGEKTETCIEISVRMILPEIQLLYPSHMPRVSPEDISITEARKWLRTLPNQL